MTILTAILTSIISSLLFGWFYLNLQYHKSNAGFRLQQIIGVTNYLVREFHETGVGIMLLSGKSCDQNGTYQE